MAYCKHIPCVIDTQYRKTPDPPVAEKNPTKNETKTKTSNVPHYSRILHIY